MCSLKPKDRFHLFGIALIPAADRESAGPSMDSETQSTQMEQVREMLHLYTSDRGHAEDDPRRKFITALAQAALQASRSNHKSLHGSLHL